MKPSQFNVYFPIPGSHCVGVYNTWTGQSVVLNSRPSQHRRLSIEEKAELLRGATGVNRLRLISAGLLVPEELNEFELFDRAHQGAKSDKRQFKIVAVTTLRCNLKCQYCYQGQVKPSATMSISTADRLVRFINRRVERDHPKAVVVGIYGGEPLLAAKVGGHLMRQVSRSLQSHNIHLEFPLITNGYLLESLRHDDIVGCATSVHLTLDGDKDDHDVVRISRTSLPTFDRIMKGVKCLLEMKKKIIIRIHARSLTSESLHSLLTRLQHHGISPDSSVVLYLMAVEQPCELSAASSCGAKGHASGASKEVTRIANLIRDVEHHPLSPLIYRQFHSPQSPLARRVIVCEYQAHSVLTVNWDGNITLCPRLVGRDDHRVVGKLDDAGQFVATDLRSHVLDEKRHNNPMCPSCEFLPVCGGPCLLKPLPTKNADCATRKSGFLTSVENYMLHQFKSKTLNHT